MWCQRIKPEVATDKARTLACTLLGPCKRLVNKIKNDSWSGILLSIVVDNMWGSGSTSSITPNTDERGKKIGGEERTQKWYLRPDWEKCSEHVKKTYT